MSARAHAFALQHWRQGESPPELPGKGEGLAFVHLRGLRRADARACLVLGTESDDPGERSFAPCPELDWLHGAPIIEVASYHVQPDLLEFHGVVLDAFGRAPGARGVHRAQAVHDPCHRLDILGWDRAADHDAGPAFVRATCPVMDRFFAGIEKVELLELFVVDA